MSDRSVNSATPKQKRRLAPSEKYEVFVSVLTGQATQREAALSASVPGRPGMSAQDAELAAAREEIERLRATVTEQAVALHLHQGKSGWD